MGQCQLYVSAIKKSFLLFIKVTNDNADKSTVRRCNRSINTVLAHNIDKLSPLVSLSQQVDLLGDTLTMKHSMKTFSKLSGVAAGLVLTGSVFASAVETYDIIAEVILTATVTETVPMHLGDVYAKSLPGEDGTFTLSQLGVVSFVPGANGAGLVPMGGSPAAAILTVTGANGATVTINHGSGHVPMRLNGIAGAVAEIDITSLVSTPIDTGTMVLSGGTGIVSVGGVFTTQQTPFAFTDGEYIGQYEINISY